MQDEDVKQPLVSIIIPTYNRAEMVCDCVRSVLANTWTNLEVIVADDCSPDDTETRVKATFAAEPRVHYTRTTHNVLASGARNQGARVAQGEFYFFLDDDNLLDRDCIAELVAVYRRHPQATLVAPLTINGATGAERLIWTTGSYYNFWTSRGADKTPPGTRLDNLPSGLEWPTSYSPNAFMVTRAAFEAVNGFDEGFGIQFEEADFGIRVTELIGEGWISSLARTNHIGYVQPGKVSALRGLGIDRPKRAYAFGRNRMKFIRRHAKWYQALSVTFVFAPLTAAYYLLQSIRHRSPHCGLAYALGTLAGVFGIYSTRGCSLPTVSANSA